MNYYSARLFMINGHYELIFFKFFFSPGKVCKERENVAVMLPIRKQLLSSDRNRMF